MPTFNRAGMLRENIASLLKSDYAFELLVVDDGSTDETERVVKSFKDPRITYCRNSINMGYAKSLNKGIANAKNSKVLLCEDDVFILRPSEFIETLVREIHNKTIVATHLLADGNEIKNRPLERLRRFFAEPLAGEIYLYYGHKRRVVRFCNNCFGFDKKELSTRFEESYLVRNLFRIESDFQMRAREEGAVIIYNPELVADHKRYASGGLRVNEKNEFLYLCTINHILFLSRHSSPLKVCAYVLLRILMQPSKHRLVARALRKYFSTRNVPNHSDLTV